MRRMWRVRLSGMAGCGILPGGVSGRRYLGYRTQRFLQEVAVECRKCRRRSCTRRRRCPLRLFRLPSTGRIRTKALRRRGCGRYRIHRTLLRPLLLVRLQACAYNDRAQAPSLRAPSPAATPILITITTDSRIPVLIPLIRRSRQAVGSAMAGAHRIRTGSCPPPQRLRQ